MPATAARQSPLRHRDGHHARVTFEELFFDLVYVFAVTQLSHSLLHHLGLTGLIETLILWFGVWLGWQYTGWFTNWFDPEAPRIRGLLFVTMLLAMVMAASLPEAFGERGLIFAASYAAMQVGRTGFIVWELGPDHPLSANYRRMLGWLLIAAVFWVAGGLAPHGWRIALWLLAIACEYLSPMFGFALPGMGRSRTSDWTIEGAHLVERCGLFVIVALGETLLASGALLAQAERWTPDVLLALAATFAGTLALWWLYFGTSNKEATAVITHAKDPGRIGAYLHYVHAILIAGVIGCAVGNDLVMAHPHAMLELPQALLLAIGPMVYLLGSAVYKRVVHGRVPRSHLVGALGMLLLVPLSQHIHALGLGWMATAMLLAVGFLDRRPPATQARP